MERETGGSRAKNKLHVRLYGVGLTDRVAKNVKENPDIKNCEK